MIHNVSNQPDYRSEQQKHWCWSCLSRIRLLNVVPYLRLMYTESVDACEANTISNYFSENGKVIHRYANTYGRESLTRHIRLEFVLNLNFLFVVVVWSRVAYASNVFACLSGTLKMVETSMRCIWPDTYCANCCACHFAFANMRHRPSSLCQIRCHCRMQTFRANMWPSLDCLTNILWFISHVRRRSEMHAHVSYTIWWSSMANVKSSRRCSCLFFNRFQQFANHRYVYVCISTYVYDAIMNDKLKHRYVCWPTCWHFCQALQVVWGSKPTHRQNWLDTTLTHSKTCSQFATHANGYGRQRRTQTQPHRARTQWCTNKPTLVPTNQQTGRKQASSSSKRPKPPKQRKHTIGRVCADEQHHITPSDRHTHTHGLTQTHTQTVRRSAYYRPYTYTYFIHTSATFTENHATHDTRAHCVRTVCVCACVSQQKMSPRSLHTHNIVYTKNTATHEPNKTVRMSVCLYRIYNILYIARHTYTLCTMCECIRMYSKITIIQLYEQFAR